MRTTALIVCLLVASVAARGEDQIRPIASVAEGVRLVQSFSGKPQDFELAVPDSLIDPTGINIAIITNEVLKRGWMPAGFTQRQGYRVFRCKEFTRPPNKSLQRAREG